MGSEMCIRDSPSPAPSGWQGVSAHHAGYRRDRMQEFRRVLETFEIDGIWLDYHHAHAAWEQAAGPNPDRIDAIVVGLLSALENLVEEPAVDAGDDGSPVRRGGGATAGQTCRSGGDGRKKVPSIEHGLVAEDA